ncbi:MAG: ATPase [Bacteroidetes bacterium]|nr:MAG: ATPase [Bacteroidota bacterium]
MAKYKFVKEFDFHASAKMLYHYISTANGLAEWFVDKVMVDDNHVFHFEWQGESLKATMKTHKMNGFVKFEFFPKPGDLDTKNPNYLDIHLNSDELIGLTYVKITDFSEMDDEVALNEMWDNFMETLREKVGG